MPPQGSIDRFGSIESQKVPLGGGRGALEDVFKHQQQNGVSQSVKDGGLDEQNRASNLAETIPRSAPSSSQPGNHNPEAVPAQQLEGSEGDPNQMLHNDQMNNGQLAMPNPMQPSASPEGATVLQRIQDAGDLQSLYGITKHQ